MKIFVAWCDSDLQEISVTVSSKHFSGEVSLYAGYEELNQLANCIHGFPLHPEDRREFVMGQPNLPGYGTVKIELSCQDPTGHVVVQASLRANHDQFADQFESCVVQVNTVPSDIDRFEAELRVISGLAGETAVLGCPA